MPPCRCPTLQGRSDLPALLRGRRRRRGHGLRALAAAFSVLHPYRHYYQQGSRWLDPGGHFLPRRRRRREGRPPGALGWQGSVPVCPLVSGQASGMTWAAQPGRHLLSCFSRARRDQGRCRAPGRLLGRLLAFLALLSDGFISHKALSEGQPLSCAGRLASQSRADLGPAVRALARGSRTEISQDQLAHKTPHQVLRGTSFSRFSGFVSGVSTF